MGSCGSEKTPKGWGHQIQITVDPLHALGLLGNMCWEKLSFATTGHLEGAGRNGLTPLYSQ